MPFAAKNTSAPSMARYVVEARVGLTVIPLNGKRQRSYGRWGWCGRERNRADNMAEQGYSKYVPGRKAHVTNSRKGNEKCTDLSLAVTHFGRQFVEDSCSAERHAPELVQSCEGLASIAYGRFINPELPHGAVFERSARARYLESFANTYLSGCLSNVCLQPAQQK